MAPEGMVPVADYGKLKGIAAEKVIELIRDGSYVGRRVGEDWFIDRSELKHSKRTKYLVYLLLEYFSLAVLLWVYYFLGYIIHSVSSTLAIPGATYSGEAIYLSGILLFFGCISSFLVILFGVSATRICYSHCKELPSYFYYKCWWPALLCTPGILFFIALFFLILFAASS